MLAGGLAILALALGFIFQVPLVTNLWPDGRLSHLFLGSILAAVSAAALWIGRSGEFGALPAGSLNILVIAVTTAIYFFLPDHQNLSPFRIPSLLIALASGVAFFGSRRVPLRDLRPMPALVKVSFGIFTAVLLLAGLALILLNPIFPWDLNPDSSIVFGCIFLGDAFYFLYGLFHPRWHNACGQLLSFLAYDVVLIGPFLALFKTTPPEHLVSLIIYIAVLIYSGALAVYFLFIHPQTRFGS